MERNYLKLFSALAFLAFAAVSCWATVESVKLILDINIPVIFIWVLTVGFFFIASWGSKMIVDSLNSNVYIEHPGLQLVGGIVIMLIFWLICSMPTNTHTFYYRSEIDKVAVNDLTRTQNYLRMLQTNEVNNTQMERDWDKYQGEVWSTFESLRLEANHPERQGIGQRFENIMLKLDQQLGEKIEPRLSPKTNTISGWNEVLEKYRQTIVNRLNKKKIEFIKRYPGVQNPKVKEDINKKIENINVLLENIKNVGAQDERVQKQIHDVLPASYSIIATHADNINFKNGDETRYIAKDKEGKSIAGTTDVDRLLSVFDTWRDFLNGNLPNNNFIYWIIIAILVDVAGFIFFDFAFRKEN